MPVFTKQGLVSQVTQLCRTMYATWPSFFFLINRADMFGHWQSQGLSQINVCTVNKWSELWIDRQSHTVCQTNGQSHRQTDGHKACLSTVDIRLGRSLFIWRTQSFYLEFSHCRYWTHKTLIFF